MYQNKKNQIKAYKSVIVIVLHGAYLQTFVFCEYLGDQSRLNYAQVKHEVPVNQITQLKPDKDSRKRC